MKIAFWSGTEHSGTTSNMLAVAAVISVIYPNSRISLRNLEKTAKTNQKCSRTDRQKGGVADYTFVDCGSGINEQKRRFLAQMDLIVVNLRQEEEELERLFFEQRIILSQAMILIGNYCDQSGIDDMYLKHTYRVEQERIGVISYNSELYQAHLSGRVRHFIKSRYGNPGCMRNELLLRELERFAKRLIIRAERKNNW